MNIAECWENVYKATNKRDTVSAISAQLSGFAATMSTSTCRSSFMLAVCSSAQYLFRKVHRRFERRSSSYVYHSPLNMLLSTSIVDKNRLQSNASDKSKQNFLAKIANSWLTRTPKQR